MTATARRRAPATPPKITKKDQLLLEQAARDAERWQSRLAAGLTAKDRERPVIAEDTGGAFVPLSALPEPLSCGIWHALYSGEHAEDAG